MCAGAKGSSAEEAVGLHYQWCAASCHRIGRSTAQARRGRPLTAPTAHTAAVRRGGGGTGVQDLRDKPSLIICFVLFPAFEDMRYALSRRIHPLGPEGQVNVTLMTTLSWEIENNEMMDSLTCPSFI